MEKCPICDKEYKTIGAINLHIFRSHNPNYVNPVLGTKREGAWNKGLTRETDSRVKKAHQTMKERYDKGELIHSGLGKKRSKETKEKISKTLINLGRTPPRGGRIKIRVNQSDGKVVYLQSSWEKTVADSLDNSNVIWERPSFLHYTDEFGKIRRYFPDFYLPEFNIFLDPKNAYLQKKDAFKIKSVSERHGVKVIVLSENQLTWDKILPLISDKLSNT